MIDVTGLSCTITIDDVPDAMRLVARECGLSTAVSLMAHLPGVDVYVPVKGHRALVRQYIQEHWTGSNAMSLAVHLGIDAKQVARMAEQLEARPVPEDPPVPNKAMELVVEACGVDVAVALQRSLPGTLVRVPMSGVQLLRRRYILKAFNGSNHAELALQLGVTVRFVRNVIASRQTIRYEQLSLAL